VSPVFLELFSVILFLFPIPNICLHWLQRGSFQNLCCSQTRSSVPGHSSNYLPLLTAKILFQSQSNSCVICGGQSDNGGSPLSAKFGVSLYYMIVCHHGLV